MKFGLLGKKLGHSFSKGYFTRKFAEEGIRAEYLNFELEDISSFPALLEAHPDLQGLNVTIPYKSAIMPLLDHLSPVAEAIGAVNVIGFENGKTIGYNTDVVGFHQSLDEWRSLGMQGPALILGTGGAAKAVYFVLAEVLKWDEVWFCSRHEVGEGVLTYAQLPGVGLDKFSLIVNTTPLGMYPDTTSCPNIPFNQLGPDHFVYDLVYNPAETLFLKNSSEAGAHTQNGLAMLHAQAEAAWELWMH
ncbi:MAG: shikimate dehydrogenase [Bacteroidia bacterium]|nr:shikimate dehydrogenase [Bacteroidia bacterium]